MVRPVSNRTLEQLIIASGYSHGAVARHVNVAMRGGTAYDKATVYYWLRGRNPGPETHRALAAVLTRALGRRVDPAELGFGTTGPVLDRVLDFAPSITDGIETATALWTVGMDRRSFLTGSAYVAGATPAAALAWHFTPDDHTAARPLDGTRVGPGHVEALHRARMRFLDIDREQGGGSARQWVTDYLVRQVAPLLRGRYDDHVGRDLLGAAAQITEQCGYMYYDSGAHGAAQRYFVQALRLAKAAGDRALSAHVMSNMSVQACFLGRAADAVQLARAAQTAAGTNAPAALMGRLADTEARGHALLGDERGSRHALARSADHLERIGTGPTTPDWLTSYTPAHHAGSRMHVLRDLGRLDEAARQAESSTDTGSTGVRALHSILFASVLLRRGEADHACSIATRVLDTSHGVASKRLLDRIAEFRAEAAAHARIPAVTDFLEPSRTARAN